MTKNPGGDFWISLGVTQLYAWGFLVAACRLVPFAWQDRARFPESPPGTRPEVISATGAERSRLLAINPFFWLAARGRFKKVLIWMTLFAGGLVWLWWWSAASGNWGEPTFVVTGFLAHLLLKFWMAAEACRRFSEDRKSGALELLLCTPLSIAQILRGQQLALWQQFGGPVTAVLLVDAVFVVLGMDRSQGAPASRWMWLILCGSGIAIFLLDLWALSWVSMWLGLSSVKNLRSVIAAACWRILILPWLIFGLSMTFFGLLLFPAGSLLFPEKVVPLYWLAIAVIVDLMFGWSARRRLREKFRLAAAENPSRRGSWFFFGRDESRPKV